MLRGTVNRRPAAALFCGALGLWGCSRPPALAVTADSLPAQTRSLAVSVTRAVVSGADQSTADALDSYDLPDPTPSRQSFLLRLPTGFSGTLGVSLAAFSGPGGGGCLQRVGFASHEFTPQPYDDSLVVPLDIDVSETGCGSATAATPRLVSATPPSVGTAGGDLTLLRGWGFTPGSDVFFDDVKSKLVRVAGAHELRVVAPEHAKAGPANLRVVLPGGATTQRADLLSYHFSSLDFVSNPAVTVPFTVKHAEFADINGDQQVDVLLTPVTGNVLTSLLLPQKTPTSYSIGGTMGVGPCVPAILSDLDRDGKPDLVTGLVPSREIITRRNSGSAAIFEAAVSYAITADPSVLRVSDLNGDGASDVVALSETGRMLFVLLNDGSGRLGAPRAIALNQSVAPFAVSAVDINRDGLKDLMVIDRSKPQLEVLSNGAGGGPGLFAATDGAATVNVLPTAASGLTIYDLDGDSAADALVALTSQNIVLAYYSRPGVALVSTPIQTCPGPQIAIAGDLDADGVREVIVACSTQQLQILQRGKTGAYQELLRSAIPVGLGSLLSMGAIDYDRDGLVDIILSGSAGFGVVRNQSH